MTYLMYNIVKSKESMIVTNVSNNKDTIIKQEIYVQMMIYNTSSES